MDGWNSQLYHSSSTGGAAAVTFLMIYWPMIEYSFDARVVSSLQPICFNLRGESQQT